MSIRIDSDSIMAQNFFNASSEESRYVRAKNLAVQADRQAMSSRQGRILAAGAAACATVENMSQRILEGKRAARQMGFDMQQSAFAASERILDELRRQFEEKAQQGQKNPEQGRGAALAENYAKTGAAASLPDSLPNDLAEGLADKAAGLAENMAADPTSAAGAVMSKSVPESTGTAPGNLSAAGGGLRGAPVNLGAGVATTAMDVGAPTGGRFETLGVAVVV